MRKRHRWVKIRLHVYMCRQCGTGRENKQNAAGDWYVQFHLPSGASVVDPHVPACEVGIQTPARLAKYASAIECSVRSTRETPPAGMACSV